MGRLGQTRLLLGELCRHLRTRRSWAFPRKVRQNAAKSGEQFRSHRACGKLVELPAPDAKFQKTDRLVG